MQKGLWKSNFLKQSTCFLPNESNESMEHEKGPKGKWNFRNEYPLWAVYRRNFNNFAEIRKNMRIFGK